MLKSSGDKIAPWGTPWQTERAVETVGPILTVCDLPVRQLSNHFTTFGEATTFLSFARRIVWFTMSKAFDKSNRISAVTDFSSIAFRMVFPIKRFNLSQEWCFYSRFDGLSVFLFFVRYELNWFKAAFSQIFEKKLRKEIWLRDYSSWDYNNIERKSTCLFVLPPTRRWKKLDG